MIPLVALRSEWRREALRTKLWLVRGTLSMAILIYFIRHIAMSIQLPPAPFIGIKLTDLIVHNLLGA